MADLQTFAEFMHEALYDESRGYYTTSSRQFGRGGDFYTAPQVHELFGALLAEEFASIDRALGCPERFTIVELGPGRGEFARDALSALRGRHPDLFARLRYVGCEISPALRREQLDRLADFPATTVQVVDPDEPSLNEPVVGVYFANEFFDALPVHIVRQEDGKLSELYVATDGEGRRRWERGAISRPELLTYWRRAGLDLLDGQRAEISLAGVEWLEKIARRLQRGRLMAIDYGDLAARLYTPDRPDGTLRAYRDHRLIDDPLANVGAQDLTASVNFSALIEYGRDFGLEMISFARLTDYLIGLGLLDRAAELSAAAGNESPAALQHRLALKQLFLPQGLAGSFRVLMMDKHGNR